MELKTGDLLYRISIYNALINSFGVLTDLDTPRKSIKYRTWLRKGISLFAKIVNSDSDHILYDLLPEKKSRYLRERKHSFILPKIRTERFKRPFLNKCLFDYFN